MKLPEVRSMLARVFWALTWAYVSSFPFGGLAYALGLTKGGTNADVIWHLALLPSCLVGILVYHALDPKRPDDDFTRCGKCGYILKGLTEPRCPECGQRL